MRLDIGSFAFGYSVATGGNTPSWGTALGQQDGLMITYPGSDEIVLGMLYKSIPVDKVYIPLGKGGRFCCSKDDDGIQLAALFDNVYVNGIQIDAPFIMVIYKEHTASWSGRRTLKYNQRIEYRIGADNIIRNTDFISKVKKTLQLQENACWLVSDISIVNQSELRITAVIIDPNASVTYKDSGERVTAFRSAVEKNDMENGNRVKFSINAIIDYISKTGLLYSDNLIKRFVFSLMSKRFLILSGLSGSGKTQLALSFANALIENRNKQLCMVSVGADWTSREPLLGYPNALQHDSYVKPENGVLDLLIEANKIENANKPFFLILDEMNMSYVERYFADFLSAMESHENISLWQGFENEESCSERVPQSISLPDNLFIIGTINVDETTYMFSPKVLDRANVIEFKISTEEMSGFMSQIKDIKRGNINGVAADMAVDFVKKSRDQKLDNTFIDVLELFFNELKSVNAEFGYRSATEICRFISMAQRNDDTSNKMTDNDILDAAIAQKLLPKLHGSRKKLERVLRKIWELCFDDGHETTTIAEDNVCNAKYPISADKIRRMYEIANSNGFTSFAEA